LGFGNFGQKGENPAGSIMFIAGVACCNTGFIIRLVSAIVQSILESTGRHEKAGLFDEADTLSRHGMNSISSYRKITDRIAPAGTM
jgi:hypothetical protein